MKKLLSLLCIALLAAFAGDAVLHSAGDRAAAVPVPRIAFEKYRLANGLEVILVQNHRLPTVAVNLWYHVGWANEKPGRTGFAHLFEHMMFQGSRHIPNDRWFQLLESVGATEVNGSTGPDRTNYMETLPANQLERALWMESDRMGYLLDTLDQEKLTGQIDVVRNERRQSDENRPYGIIDEALFQALFPAPHPYHAAGIGSHADIEASRLDDVRAFFREYYVPNNASLAIVGDIDVAATRALVEKYFGPLRRGADVPRPVITPPARSAEQRLTVTDSVELPRLYLGWNTPALLQPGDAEADLLASLLGGGKSSRLYQRLVYERQIAQDVSAYQYSMGQGSLFSIQATARPGHTLAELEGAIDAELAALQRQGPTEAELQRARNQQVLGLIGGLESNGGLADLLNHYNQNLGRPDGLAQDLARYRRADVAAVRDFARTLTTSRRIVIQGVPGEKHLQDVPRQPVAAAPGAASPGVNADAPWRAQPPPSGPAPAFSLPVPQRATLSNGLTVLLLEQHELPLLSMGVYALRGGAMAAPGLAGFTADMLDEGTMTRTAPQLADAAAQLGTQLGSRAGRDATALFISTLSKDGTAALELLADVLLHPAFAPAEIERVRNRRLTALLQQREQPDALASRAFSLALYGPAHPYGQPELGTEESVRAIQRAALVNDWRTQFTPGNSVLVVSGDITLAELKPLAERLLGLWRGPRDVSALPEPHGDATHRLLLIDKPGSPQSELRIGQIGAARSSPDYVPLEVMNTILGGQFSSRINMNLREQHGYTYNAYSQFGFRRGAGPWVAYGGVRTDVTADAIRQIFAEINRTRDTPVSDAELAGAKEAFARSLPAAFDTNADASATMAGLFVYGLPLDYYGTLPGNINATSIADVQRVARQYLQPEKMTVVAVGDRAKISTSLAALGLGTVTVMPATF